MMDYQCRCEEYRRLYIPFDEEKGLPEFWSPYVDWVSAQDLELPVEDTKSLLDSIEDMELFSLLHTVDKLTLEILFMKMDGYSSKEIASAFGMDEYAVNMRIYRLRKKIKKYL